MKKKTGNNKQPVVDKESLSGLFKALSDPNRLNILNYLCCPRREKDTSANVKDVASCCDVDLSVVSRHLSALKDSGVLESEKRGKEVFYSVNGSKIADILRAMADHIEGKSTLSMTDKKGDDYE